MAIVQVKNQYYFDFSLGGDGGIFETEDDLRVFIMTEEAGNVLPTAKLVFTVPDRKEKVLEKCNEGNILQVSFGRDPNKKQTSKFSIVNAVLERAGQFQYVVELGCIYDALPYLSVPRIFATDKIQGTQAIQDTASTYFNVQSNVQSSGTQYWLQSNIPDKAFVNQIWMHSYVPNSFISIGITSDGRFKMRDLKKDTDNKWKIGYSDDPDIIKFGGDYSFDERHGLLNQWVGYGRERKLWDIDNCEYKDVTEDFNPFIAMTSNFNRNSGVEKKVAAFRPLNENVDPNYYNAYLRNITSAALHSAGKFHLGYYNEFFKMEVLDRCFLMDDRPTQQREIAPYQSGAYYITHITRSLTAKNFNTVVDLVRESFNMGKGSLR